MPLKYHLGNDFINNNFFIKLPDWCFQKKDINIKYIYKVTSHFVLLHTGETMNLNILFVAINRCRVLVCPFQTCMKIWQPFCIYMISMHIFWSRLIAFATIFMKILHYDCSRVLYIAWSKNNLLEKVLLTEK